MGEVLQLKMVPREEPDLSGKSDECGSIASVLYLWTFNLIQNIFSSLRLTYWYLNGHEVVMDFEFDSSMAKFLKHPSADEKIWHKMHAVYFEHFSRDMAPEFRAPFTVRKFMKSNILPDGKIVRIYFETDLWAGDGEKPVESCGIPREEADMKLFKCQFMLETE